MAAIAIVHFVNYPKGQDRPCMAGVMRYTAREDKTEWQGRQLVSGFNCRPESVYDDFLSTKLLHYKEGGTLFYHLVQSFPAGEQVDPSAAHATALKLAEYFQGREVLVCTHTDRDHIHSHLIINSVSLEDGKKLHVGKQELEKLRQRNDEACMEMGLPVFQSKQERNAKPMSDKEYRSAAKGESWKFQTMNAIDQCMRHSASREDFVSKMERLGYSVRWEPGRKNITYTHPNGKKVRDRKLHEEKYWKEWMEREFAIRQQVIAGGVEAAQRAAARYLGDADGDGARGPSYGGRMAGAAGDAVECGRVVGDAGCAPGGVGPTSAHPAVLGADAGYGKGADCDSGAAGAGGAEAGTGWEEERAAFFTSMVWHPAGALRVGVAAPAPGLGALAGAAVDVGAALERTQRPVYVTRPHSDKKALRREREKKIAAGHRPDDHEDYTMAQTL